MGCERQNNTGLRSERARGACHQGELGSTLRNAPTGVSSPAGRIAATRRRLRRPPPIVSGSLERCGTSTSHYSPNYLRRALRNRVVSWIRHQQQRRKLEARLAAQGVALALPSAETCATLAEQLEPLLDALDRQHPAAADALWLVKIEGLSATAAGERMGKSPHQVRRLVARALLFLTPALEGGDTP